MSKNKVAEWSFEDGYASSVPRTVLRKILAYGSSNVILTGLGFIRNFGGLDPITLINGGSWQFFQTDNTFAGLGDEISHGKGSIFKVQRVLVCVGQGAVRVGGTNTGVNANSTLQYLKKVSGAWVSPGFPASQARPSSQTIYPKVTRGAGFTAMDGAIATVIWRIDSTTGQVSLASLPSNVISASSQSIIQPFPATDTGQDYWGIGVCKPGFGTAPVFYQLKTDLGGEVAETTLAYTRTIAQGSITSADKTLTLNAATPLANRFTAGDVGRKAVIAGKLNSWIVTVTDAFNAEVNDNATATATNESTIIIHAVEGIERAVEIAWTTTSLAGQELAPYDAYPSPSNLVWAGILNDAMFVETTDGIIYVGVVGFLGSFPPKNTLFPSEAATAYLDGSDGLYWRFSKSTLSVLTYIGGAKPLELQTIWKNVGILFPQNAAVGEGGRVIAWSGKPVRLGAGREPDIAFAFHVYKDFEGWNNQTKEMPVICQNDPENHFDCWAYNRTIMCIAASGNWCAPINVGPYMAVGEYLISATIVNNRLRWATNKGTLLKLYQFDAGICRTMIVKTPEAESSGESDTITQIEVNVHLDNTNSIEIRVVKNFDDINSELIATVTPTATPTTQTISRRSNVRNAKQYSVIVEIESSGKNVGVEKIEAYGESNGIYVE